MSMKIYCTFVVLLLCHEVISLKPNYCEFYDEFFEYMPKIVTVQQRKERKKDGIGAFLNPKNLLNRKDYENVTKTELIAVKRMRSYVTCCLGFVKVDGECVSKSNLSTNANSPSLPATSSASSVITAVPSQQPTTAKSPLEAVEGVTFDEQIETATPVGIRLNENANKNLLMNDELDIPGMVENETDEPLIPNLIADNLGVHVAT